jgi:hypothetical protein
MVIGEKKMGNERNYEELIESNPILKEGLMTLAEDEEIIFSEVQKLLEKLEMLVLDKDSKFEIKHAFLMLTKSILYVASGLCDDIEDYHKELEKSNKIVTDIFLKALLDEEHYDELNFSDLRLILTGASLIEYVFLRKLFDIKE